MIEIIKNDILESKEKYIAHSCNCISSRAAGVAKSIFDKYPYGDTYACRKLPDVPGTISILGNGYDFRYIINMFSLYYPGNPKYPNSSLDGMRAREKYFHQCLMKVSRIENLESIAFPYKISCNLGGGNWDHYLGTLTNFANHIYKTQNAKTYLYKL